eukprot:1291325-Rhodomonas_salina.1
MPPKAQAGRARKAAAPAEKAANGKGAGEIAEGPPVSMQPGHYIGARVSIQLWCAFLSCTVQSICYAIFDADMGWQCGDGVRYEGNVDSYDPKTCQYHVTFDDGDEVETVIDDTAWDVQVLSSGSSPSTSSKGSGADTASAKTTPQNKRGRSVDTTPSKAGKSGAQKADSKR